MMMRVVMMMRIVMMRTRRTLEWTAEVTWAAAYGARSSGSLWRQEQRRPMAPESSGGL
jgi:hypothetical protein